MGTSRSGLYLNTAGSRRTISDYTLVHSVEGTYVNVGSTDPNKPLRLLMVEGMGKLCSRY